MAIFRSRARVLNSWWHRRSIRKAARKQGRRDIPAVESAVRATYEDMLIGQTQQVVHNIDCQHDANIARLQEKLYGSVERMRPIEYASFW